MHDGAVEATRYPRNPLDIVAQQIVAMTSMDTWDADELFATIRRRRAVCRVEPHGLRRRARHAVGPLPLGRIRRAAAARHVGSRHRNRHARAKARSASPSPTAARFPTADSSASFSPARGAGAARVGELDEEMVFETRVGETFVLGASTWRIEEITHDRVLVSPAPGEPGKMPFWKGDRAGRPLELGLAIGALMRDLLRLPPAGRDRTAHARSRSRRARRREPAAVSARSDRPPRAPSPTTAPSSIERVRDELGDWRVCVLSPCGGRIHAPWAMAVGGEDPRGDRRRRRDDVGRRRVRGPVSGRRRAAATPRW